MAASPTLLAQRRALSEGLNYSPLFEKDPVRF